MPGDFLSSRGAKAIKCSVKAAEGYLYPLKSSIVFIHKPVLYIRHSELRFVEFSRIGQGSSGLSRSFDVTLTKLADDSKVTFMSIDKEEQACLIAYFKAANVKMRTVDLETNIHEDLGSEDEEKATQLVLESYNLFLRELRKWNGEKSVGRGLTQTSPDDISGPGR